MTEYRDIVGPQSTSKGADIFHVQSESDLPAPGEVGVSIGIIENPASINLSDGFSWNEVWSSGVSEHTLTPTIYFDPSKTSATSTGAGTEANPAFTAEHLSSLIPTDSKNVVLGCKRGTVLREGINIQTSSSRADFPFRIVPYGDAIVPTASASVLAPMLIDVGINLTGWTLYDSANNIWTKPLSRARNLWQLMNAATNTEKRIVQLGNDTLANKLAKLIDVSSGYWFWDSASGGVQYLKPHGGVNPNEPGVIIADSGKASSAGGTPLYISLANQAKSGNISISGIACRHSPSSNISIIASSASTSITSIGQVTVTECDVRHNGYPINNSEGSNPFSGNELPLSSGGGNSGVSVYGYSDSIRMPIDVRNNYVEDCGNNAVETKCVSGGYIEYNSTKDVYGYAWSELYASTSNVITQYNDAQYDTLLSHPTYNGGRGMTVAEYGGGLFWAAGYNNANQLTQATLALSSGNICRLNTSYNCPSKSGGNTKSVQDAGQEGLIIEKNIIHLKMQYSDGGPTPISLTESIGTSGIPDLPTSKLIFRKNVVYIDFNIQNSDYPIPFPQIVPYAVTPAAGDAFSELDYNVYFIPQYTRTDQIRYRKNNLIEGSAADGPAVLALWKTAIGAETNSQFINPMIGSDGQLMNSSPCKHLFD